MHKADAQALRLMSAFGGKAGIDRHGSRMARSLMTQLRHWVCTAAIVLMPVSAPIKVLD
jgi:hypothetical protein